MILKAPFQLPPSFLPAFDYRGGRRFVALFWEPCGDEACYHDGQNYACGLRDNWLFLDAADEKNREGNEIPLRGDLAADLSDWLSFRLERIQAEALERGEPIPARLPSDMAIFKVPARLVKILDRDLVLAGIARRVKVDGKWRIEKSDERGRTIDVHALRHTFGTLLSKGGVAPQTAQAAMRHSDIKLTMNVYTDPKLLDVAGALDALPALPLDGGQTEREALRATGTEGGSARTLAPLLAPTLAPTADKRSEVLSIADNLDGEASPGTLAVSADDGKRKDSLTIPVSESSSRGDKTAIELFIAGVRGWEAGLRRRVEDRKPSPE